MELQSSKSGRILGSLSSGINILQALCCCLLALASNSGVAARHFIVGGKDGWILHPAEDYNHWSSRNRFLINDTIYFKYKAGEDSVLVVSHGDYNGCNTSNPIQKWDDGNTTLTLDRSGPFYFISGQDSHCQQGQKLIVHVLAVRLHPPPGAPSTNGSAPATPPPKSPPGARAPTPPPQAHEPPAATPAGSPPGTAFPPGATPPNPPGSAMPPSGWIVPGSPSSGSGSNGTGTASPPPPNSSARNGHRPDVGFISTSAALSVALVIIQSYSR